MCPGYLACLPDSLYVFAHKFHFDEANVLGPPVCSNVCAQQPRVVGLKLAQKPELSGCLAPTAVPPSAWPLFISICS